jgi:hypothetical protein
MGLAHSRPRVDQGTRNEDSQTSFNEIDERFNRSRGDSVIAS